jgi:hypothetical protein
MATFSDPAGDAGLVEIGALQVDQHHDHLIAQGLGVSDAIDLGGMGIDRFKAEAHALLQQLIPLPFR